MRNYLIQKFLVYLHHNIKHRKTILDITHNQGGLGSSPSGTTHRKSSSRRTPATFFILRTFSRTLRNKIGFLEKEWRIVKNCV